METLCTENLCTENLENTSYIDGWGLVIITDKKKCKSTTTGCRHRNVLALTLKCLAISKDKYLHQLLKIILKSHFSFSDKLWEEGGSAFYEYILK